MERLAHPDKVSVSETELRNLIFTTSTSWTRVASAGN
jgi:hypothetical protein